MRPSLPRGGFSNVMQLVFTMTAFGNFGPNQTLELSEDAAAQRP
jgi:hypothetical protein